MAQFEALKRELEDAREALRAVTERERLLAHELQHRVRNMLAVLRSIYRRTRERGASPDEFAEHFEGRLGAIARYQADIARISAGGIELEDIVRDELLDVQCVDGPNCTIMGPPVHELTTNAVKFGALCHGGTLAVEWSLAGSTGEATLQFRWVETGLALLSAAPRPRGFGQDLIEDALPYELGATTSFDFKPGGIECSILLPLPASGEPSSPDWDASGEATSFQPSAAERSW